MSTSELMLEEVAMNRRISFLVIFLLTSFFVGCTPTRISNSTGIRIGRCWTDSMEIYSSVSFDDSLKVQIPYDTVYLSLAFPAKTNFYVKYVTSTTLHDVMTVKVDVSGEHVFGEYVQPKDTFIWKHDTVRVRFDYNDTRLSSYTWLNKDSPKETFVIQNVAVYFPMNKTIIYLEY
jgi:hypothetical protein